MKHRILHIIILLTCLSTVAAQAPYDCEHYIPVCDDRQINLDVSGYGKQELSAACGCSSDELNSLWLKVTIAQSGTFGFTLTPVDTSINVDYDFWVFGPNADCNNIASTLSIRCSTTNPSNAGLTHNLTGMNGTETDYHEGPGNDGNSFVHWIDALAGESYLIIINRPHGNGPFSLNWTGTAVIQNPFEAENFGEVPPFTVCGDSNSLVRFDWKKLTRAYMLGHDTSLFSTTYYHNPTDATLHQNALSDIQMLPTGTYTMRIDRDSVKCYELHEIAINVIPSNMQPVVQHYETCMNEPLNISATGAFLCEWTPAKGLSATNTQHVTLTPDQTQTYIAKSYTTCANSVRNGDFETGNTAFATNCSYGGTSASAAATNGQYTVGTSPALHNAAFPAINDHTLTTGGGNMLIVNGNSLAGNVIAWQQTVAVLPGHHYRFNAWLQALSGNTNVQMLVNGNPLSTQTINNGTWQQAGCNWTNNINTLTASIAIVLTARQQHDDIAIDDITFGEMQELVDTFHITVHSPTDSAYSTEVCIGDTYLFGTHRLTQNGIYHDTLSNQHGCDSIVTLDLTFSPYLHRTIDVHLCTDQSYSFYGTTISQTGAYFDTIPSPFICDSAIRCNVTMHHKTDSTIKAEVCYGERYTLYNFDESTSGNYVQQLRSQYGCDSIVRLQLKVRRPNDITPTSDFCNDQQQNFVLHYNFPDGTPYTYSLTFDNQAIATGFTNVVKQNITTPGTIEITLPNHLKPNYYTGTLTLFDSLCTQDFQFSFIVPYRSILVQKWNDVIAVLNDRYNGGYVFTAFQWRKDGIDIAGETKSYLYLPSTLDAAGNYTALLTRTDGVTLETCPLHYTPHIDITIYPTPMKPSGAITIDMPAERSGTLTVCNSIGQPVETHELHELRNSLMLNLPCGIYILRIMTDTGEPFTQKIML